MPEGKGTWLLLIPLSLEAEINLPEIESEKPGIPPKNKKSHETSHRQPKPLPPSYPQTPSRGLPPLSCVVAFPFFYFFLYFSEPPGCCVRE